MTPLLTRLSVIALCAFAAVPAQAQEEDIDWKHGAWGDLSTHIGTYHYEAVLDDARVAAALKKQLDEETLTTLKTNLETQTPIGFEDDCLLLSGNAPSQANEEAAFVAVCLYDGKVHTALKEKGEITLYTNAQKYSYLPQNLQLWVYTQKNPEAYQLPQGVQIILTP